MAEIKLSFTSENAEIILDYSYLIRLERVGTRRFCELAAGRVGSLLYNNCLG